MLVKDLNQKICIVTGANSGIGYAVTKGLLQRGARVIMACRNAKRANEAQLRLMNETGSSDLEMIVCDLSLKKSVQNFVNEFKAKHQKLDILCQCAGNISFSRTETSEGIESNFATNVLGPHYLSKLLVPLFSKDQPCHIINIAGEFHRLFKLDFKDLFYKKSFNPLRVGSVSMLERIMLTYAMADELKTTNISVNCFHPGNVKTEMMDKLPSLLRPLSRLLGPFQISPEEGADTCLWLVTQKVSGKYFIKRQEVSSSKASYDKEAQKKLHDICEQLLNERT